MTKFHFSETLAVRHCLIKTVSGSLIDFSNDGWRLASALWSVRNLGAENYPLAIIDYSQPFWENQCDFISSYN